MIRCHFCGWEKEDNRACRMHAYDVGPTTGDRAIMVCGGCEDRFMEEAITAKFRE